MPLPLWPTSSGKRNVRIDRLLFYLRFVKTRSNAHRLVEEGHVRCNGARVVRPSHEVAVGDTLTLPAGKGACVARIIALPLRRGPSLEAQMCYRVLDPGPQTAIAPVESDQDKGTALP